MATVGQALTSPESGWKRYDDLNANISYENATAGTKSSCYDGSFHEGIKMVARFNVKGTTRLRLIGWLGNSQYTTNGTIKVDSVHVGTFTQVSGNINQILNAEVLGLTMDEHNIEISCSDDMYVGLDAIDIDENGELIPYNPTPEEPEEPTQTLLRITMIDSSEREYKLPKADIDGFVNWFTRTVGTGTSVYVLNKVLTNSKEYLAYDKIISFEVLPIA